MSSNDKNSAVARIRYRSGRKLKQWFKQEKPIEAPSFTAMSASASNQEASDLKTFVVVNEGNGIYGRWIVDDNGLPAYEYELNQYEDERAKYPVSVGAFRRDNWHQVGNSRITALASNDGTVQVFIGDQGFMFLNHFNEGKLFSLPETIWEFIKIFFTASTVTILRPLTQLTEPGVIDRLRSSLNLRGSSCRDSQIYNYAGGYGYIKQNDDVWATAYLYNEAIRDNAKRIFGMGYFKTSSTQNGIQVDRTVYAPEGDIPALLIDVDLTNTTNQDMSFSYYEYWDVNIHQLPEQLLRTGFFAIMGNTDRRHLNCQFTPCINWDEDARALRFHLQPPAGFAAPQIPADINNLPNDIFLADLSGMPDEYYVNKESFFGAGRAEKPDMIKKPVDPNDRPIMPYCMVLRRDVTIAAGETKQLRFAYGTVEPNDNFACSDNDTAVPTGWMKDLQDQYGLDNTPDAVTDLSDYWKNQLTYFSTPEPDYMHREMAWHTYYLMSSTLKNTFFDLHVVPQGSAYLYLHGIDGAPRDFALYVIPLCYVNQTLAKEMLAFIMQMTYGDEGQMAYAYTGNGTLSGAIIHTKPSDLDLFFLFALTEYLAVTGDYGFLDEIIPFYPARNQPNDRRVIEHIRLAFDHLMDVEGGVGIGSNDLFRVSDGDWSDDVVVRNVFPFKPLVSPGLTIKDGESVLNTQMALYILPRMANVLLQKPSPEAQELGAHIHDVFNENKSRLEAGLEAMWRKDQEPNYGHYARAILRYWNGGNYVLHEDLKEIDLEAQVWPLIGDFEDQERRDIMVNTIYDKLDKDSPIGARLKTGQVWPAISQLLTWGYTHYYPEKAWDSFKRLSLTTRANVYGNWWSNILSGPDGVNGPTNTDPGFTYQSPPATPMTDFPVMNNNQHAMPLFAMLRVCGIEPHVSGEGIRIRPQVPDTYQLDMRLFKLDVTPTHIQGEYRAQNDGDLMLFVKLPDMSDDVVVTVNNVTVDAIRDNEGYINVPLGDFKQGDVIPFEVTNTDNN